MQFAGDLGAHCPYRIYTPAMRCQGLLAPLAPYGLRQHMGDSLEEVHIIGGEATPSRRVDPQDTKRVRGTLDSHTHAADHSMVVEQGGTAKARHRAQVVNDDWRTGAQDVARIG